MLERSPSLHSWKHTEWLIVFKWLFLLHFLRSFFTIWIYLTWLLLLGDFITVGALWHQNSPALIFNLHISLVQKYSNSLCNLKSNWKRNSVIKGHLCKDVAETGSHYYDVFNCHVEESHGQISLFRCSLLF